mgnify:FL=1|jgi:hypothetical protein
MSLAASINKVAIKFNHEPQPLSFSAMTNPSAMAATKKYTRDTSSREEN